MTTYVILVQDANAGVWKERGQTDASSPARALRALGLEAGTYLAVPYRSWKPLTVSIEQTTKVTIG